MRKIRVCSATFVRRAAALSISLMLSVFLAVAQAATLREYYTIQVGSYSHKSGARSMYRTLKAQLPKRIHDLLRVELVGKYYALRIGDFRDRASTAAITAILDERKKDWLLLYAPIKEKRLRIAPKVRLYPPTPRAATGAPSMPQAAPEKLRRVGKTTPAANGSPLPAPTPEPAAHNEAGPTPSRPEGPSPTVATSARPTSKRAASPPAPRGAISAPTVTLPPRDAASEPRPLQTAERTTPSPPPLPLDGRNAVLVLAQRLLNAPSEDEQNGDVLLEHFMTMDGDGLSITDATVDNLLILAEETPRDLGVDLRATWRNNAWDSQTDNHHFDQNAIRFGVIWDVVADGFLDTRREAQDYHDRFRLAQMDANASRQGERFIYRDVLMAMHFAALRLGPLGELRLLQQARLDELITLYHSGRVFLDDVIEAQGELAETTAHIDAIHYALDQLPQYQPPPHAQHPPVLDLNMDAIAGGLRNIATQDGQRLALQESILRRKYDKAYDIDLEVFSDIGSQIDRDGRDEDFRLGLDLRIPIASSSERLLRSSMRKERVALASTRRNQRLDLLRRAGTYREKLTDAIVMHHRLLLTKERLRRALASHTLHPQPGGDRLGPDLLLVSKQATEVLKVQIELLGVKESLYRRLLQLFTEGGLAYSPDMVALWQPKRSAPAARRGERSMYIWSTVFNATPNEYILELFRIKNITRALVSASQRIHPGKLAQFLTQAQKRGIDVALMYSVNDWIHPENHARALERITRDAAITGHVHLDIEPWTLPDYADNTRRYQRALVTLARALRQRLPRHVHLSMSITPRLTPATVRGLLDHTDSLYVMIYGKTQPAGIARVLERTTLSPGECVVALRPADFEDEAALEATMTELVDSSGMARFALHDLEGYLNLTARIRP